MRSCKELVFDNIQKIEVTDVVNLQSDPKRKVGERENKIVG